jgi:hypothetical protein
MKSSTYDESSGMPATPEKALCGSVSAKRMKLFLISQDQNDDYDTFDSAVVLAPDEETARNMGMNGRPIDWANQGQYSAWCSGPEHVRVRYLGEAAFNFVEPGVICFSFNAG